MAIRGRWMLRKILMIIIIKMPNLSVSIITQAGKLFILAEQLRISE